MTQLARKSKLSGISYQCGKEPDSKVISEVISRKHKYKGIVEIGKSLE